MEEAIRVDRADIINRTNGKKHPGPQTKTRETILSLILESGEAGCTVNQLIAETGVGRSAVFEHVNRLAIDGQIRKLHPRSTRRFRLVGARIEVREYNTRGNGSSHAHFYAPYYRDGKHCMKCDNEERKRMSALTRRYMGGTVKDGETIHRAHIVRRSR